MTDEDREFLDSVLEFIDSESLTDEEFEAMDLSSPDYTKETYEALKTTLEGRENVSGQQKKLYSYFVAKGVDLSTESAVIPVSQIFIGSGL